MFLTSYWNPNIEISRKLFVHGSYTWTIQVNGCGYMCQERLFVKQLIKCPVIKTLQNFTYKHTADLENVQRY
jgi:hypothetical protein